MRIRKFWDKLLILHRKQNTTIIQEMSYILDHNCHANSKSTQK